MQTAAAIDTLCSEILSAFNTHRLAELLSEVNRRYFNGQITEAEYIELDRRVAEKRDHLRAARQDKTPFAGATTRFNPTNKARKRPRNFDRTEYMYRKRALASRSSMPDRMACKFTEGERAALYIVISEVRNKSFCDLSVKEIADRSGVCPSTVQNAIREACRLRILDRQERRQFATKSLTNVITVASPELKTWLDHAPKKINKSIGCSEKFLLTTSKTLDTLENIDSKSDGARGQRDPPS